MLFCTRFLYLVAFRIQDPDVCYSYLSTDVNARIREALLAFQFLNASAPIPQDLRTCSSTDSAPPSSTPTSRPFNSHSFFRTSFLIGFVLLVLFPCYFYSTHSVWNYITYVLLFCHYPSEHDIFEWGPCLFCPLSSPSSTGTYKLFIK